MSKSDLTLIVNRKAVEIPSDKWSMIVAKPAYCAVQIMQPFVARDADGNESNGGSGDYIVEMSGGPRIVVSAELFGVLFNEIGGSA